MTHTAMKIVEEYDIASVKNYMEKQGKTLTQMDEMNINNIQQCHYIEMCRSKLGELREVAKHILKCEDNPELSYLKV